MQTNPHAIDLAEHLYIAVKAGDCAQVARLLDEGAAWGPLAITNRPLHIAARQGDLEMARLLLARGHPVDGPAQATAPLSLAAQRGDLALMTLLVEHGADLNRALPDAIAAGQDAAALLLVECGADVHARLQYSRHKYYIAGAESLLLFTLRQKLPQTARALIARGADITATRGAYYETINALDYIARSGDTELAALLAERGLRSPNALYAALHSQHPDIVPYVLADAAFSRPFGNDKQTALHLAAALNVKSVFEPYLARGDSLDVPDGVQNTPLHEALLHRNYALADFLYDHGASMTAANQYGVTGVQKAAQAGHFTLLERWIAAGGGIHGGATPETTAGKEVPLLQALPEHPGVALLLIQHGADVNAAGQLSRQKAGWAVSRVRNTTALHQAALDGLADVARALLAYGANPHARDAEGYRAVDLAREAGHTAVAALLETETRETPAAIAAWLAERLAAYRAEFVRRSALWDPLLAAVRRGDTAAVIRRLDEGAVWLSRRLSPLSIAAAEGYLELARALLARGYPANAYPRPLPLAVARGDRPMIELLLEHGADLSHDCYEDSYWHQYQAGAPLQWAIETRQSELACWLIAQGADVAQKFSKKLYLSEHDYGSHHMTTNYLLYALSYRLPEVAVALIAHGADIHATYGDLSAVGGKYNALDLAARQGCVTALPLLVARGQELHASALIQALRAGQDEAARWLVAHGANLDAKDAGLTAGDSVLHLAAQYNMTWLTERCLAQSQDVDSPGSLSKTALHDAAQANQAAMITSLLARGAQITARAYRGNTPLHVAAASGAVDAAQVLLECGAEIDARNDLGATPLAEALQHREVEIVKFLHGRGAALDVRFKKESYAEEQDLLETVLSPSKSYFSETYDVAGRYLEMARFLIAEGAVDAETGAHRYQQHLNQRLIWIVQGQDRDTTAEAWVTQGAEIDGLWEGATPLHHALRRSKFELAQTLIALGADVARADAYGFTALHYAADLGGTALAQELLARGVDVNGATPYGYTALHYAAAGGDLALVTHLLDAGADPAAALTQGRLAGWTPLHFALSHGHAPVAAALRPLCPPAEVKPGSHGLRGDYDDGPVSLGSKKRKRAPIIHYSRARCPTCNERALYTVGAIWDGAGYDADLTVYLICANCETHFTRAYDDSLRLHTGRLPSHKLR